MTNNTRFMLELASPGASSSLSPAASITEPSSEDAAPTNVVRVRRRPIPRKGHTKSRRGCYNCKRRKVKCQETLPACGHCKRIGLACEYPPTNASLEPQGPPGRALQSTPTVFSMDDLRFFQHFLLHAYPPLPIRGVAVWRDVAALCHSYDYLVHAMLGLAASHLSLGATTSSRTSFTAQAFEHRVTAINLLNQALSEPCASKAEGDARFAAIMSLTFQSSYMPEGMLDFLSMIRGCTVVSHSAMPAFEDSMFRSFSLEGHIESLRSLNQGREDSPEDEGLVDAFLSSIRAVGALCRSTMEVRFLAAFEAVVKTAKISAVDSFAGLSAFYMIFGQATNEDFKAFRDPGNFAAQILLAHFFLVEYMIGAIALQPIMGSFPFRKEITVAWIRAIADKLPAEYDQHIRWPLEFAEFLLNDKSRGALPE